MCQNGKWYFFLLLLSSMTSIAQVTLEIRSMQEQPLEQAGVGTPFMLDVVVEQIENASSPRISLPDGCVSHATSVKTLARISGGRTNEKKVYSYIVRFDTPGTFILGPASVKDGNNSEITSQTISLTVSDAQVESDTQGVSTKSKRHKKSSDKEHDAILVTAELDKQSLVQGESAQLTFTFYSSDSSVNLERLIEPEYSMLGIEVVENGPMKTGTKKKDGTLYSYAELTRTIKPTQTGSFIIPACKVDYSVRSAHNSYFSLVLGRRVVKTAYSNGVSLQVDPLPIEDDMIDFLGSCSQCTASLSHPSITQSEAATLTFEISGDIEWKKESLVVANLPASVRLFPSEKSCKEFARGRVYRFEFVMQASGAPGDYVVPSQTIVGFDTKLRKVVQFTTHEIPFSIIGQVHQAQVTAAIKRNEDTSANTVELLPLITDSWTQYKKRELSWPLFVKLVLIPLLAAALYVGMQRIRRFLVRYQPFVVWLARREINRAIAHARESQVSNRLYESLLAYLAAVVPHVPQSIDAYTQWIASVYDSQQVNDWTQLITHLQQHRFASGQLLYGSTNIIVDQLETWVQLIHSKTVKTKRRYAFFFIAVLTVATSYSNDQEFFLQGNKEYQQHHFQRAFQSYEKMKRKGYGAYLNMGNCCYHQGNHAQAVYYWLKAKQSCPTAVVARCKENLARVATDTKAHRLVTESEPLVSTFALQLIFLFFWYILLAYWLKKGMQMKQMCATLCCICILGYGMYNRARSEGLQHAVVVTSARCHVGPSQQYRVVDTLAPASVVEVCDQKDGWVKITSGSKKGWLRSDDVTVI